MGKVPDQREEREYRILSECLPFDRFMISFLWWEVFLLRRTSLSALPESVVESIPEELQEGVKTVRGSFEGHQVTFPWSLDNQESKNQAIAKDQILDSHENSSAWRVSFHCWRWKSFFSSRFGMQERLNIAEETFGDDPDRCECYSLRRACLRKIYNDHAIQSERTRKGTFQQCASFMSFHCERFRRGLIFLLFTMPHLFLSFLHEVCRRT